MTMPATKEQQAASAAAAEANKEAGKDPEDRRKAEDRIKELTRRNSELEKLINMEQRMGNLEGAANTIAQRLNTPAAPATDDVWDPFMRPKVNPLIEEAVGPLRNAVIGLADQNDLLKTLHAYPEYNDPEVQAEVENLRRLRFQQSGQVESRENIIIYMRGRNPERFVKKTESETETREARGEQIHVESGSGVGQSRAATPAGKFAQDATVEEMEKFMSESNMKF